jgi:single-stranded-DNA-specific exonuclease
MLNKWKIKDKITGLVFENNKKYSQLMLGLLAERGLSEELAIEEFFSPNYSAGVHDPFLFTGMKTAVSRIVEAKKKKEKIGIFGDYDADGVTATAVIFETLRRLGFSEMEVYIPDRQTEGYGMNTEAIKKLQASGVSLIITVDCGITNVEEVAFANENNVDVIITDHHYVLKDLPAAVAVINPHMVPSTRDCGYPFPDLAGVGVAFKLAEALYQEIDPKNKEQLKWLLDLVAIGTIADCVPLLGENRILTKYGLVVLSKTRNVGLLEMFKVGKIVIDENNVPDTQKVAFQIAPRINASGRMNHASASYNLIVAEQTVLARDMALEVEASNQKRQKITKEIVREVKAIAENLFKNKKLVFAFNEHWQVGILGLIAGKISSELNKPTAVFQKREKEFVGSFRSIPSVNIIEALEKCSELLIRYGGHSQAAGVRVLPENMDKFYEKMLEIIEIELQGKDISPQLEIDAEISPEQVSWELLEEIKQMEPFGQGNKEPIFLLKNMLVEDFRVVGNGSKHLKLSLRAKQGSPKILESIGFGLGEKFPELQKNNTVDVVFNLQQDEWNGNKKMQLNLIDLKITD